MLDVQIRLHREYLLTQATGQKLFLTLHLHPQAAACSARPPLAVAFVVETSGSMREVVTERIEGAGQMTVLGGKAAEMVHAAKTKMDLVTESLRGLLESGLLQPGDRLALVKFDDTAEVLVPFTGIAERARLLAATERLNWYAGGTQMGSGMLAATTLLRGETGNRRLVLLMNGQTSDEALVHEQINLLADAQIPVTTVGMGDEVNTQLLVEITDRTQGRPIDVVPGTRPPELPAVRASELPAALLGDLRQAAGEVVTNVGLSIRTVKDVVLERVTRVHPTQTEVDRGKAPLPLGNVEAGGGATYILEFTLPARPSARMRLAQLGLTYQIPGAHYMGEVSPLDVIVEFTQDAVLAARVDAEVMQWVQQRNVEGLIAQATREAQTNPQQGQKTLELARSMTQRLRNGAMTQVLDRALGELSISKAISLGTAKTLKMGAKTQTIKVRRNDRSSDEDIRKRAGA